MSKLSVLGLYNTQNSMQTNNKKISPKSSLKKEAIGVASGITLSYALNNIFQTKIAGVVGLNSLKEVKQNDPVPFQNIVDKVFDKSGLAEKGVKLIDASTEKREVVLEALLENLNKATNNNPISNKLQEKNIKISLDSTINGINSYFLEKTNAILINKKLLPYCSFHEFGHAMNKSAGKFTKAIASSKAAAIYLSGLAFYTAIFKRKKTDGEKPKGVFDKFTTFVKNNVGKIGFLCSAPILIDEGLASHKALKLVKNELSSNEIKVLRTYYMKNWLTYLIAGVGIGFSYMCATKLKDMIARPEEQNQNHK